MSLLLNFLDKPELQFLAANQRMTQLAQAKQARAASLHDFCNTRTGARYEPHHAEEESALNTDRPRYIYVRGGEGSGKSVFGVQKDLRRLARGMDGIMVSPDLPHFKRSLWPEFRAWCSPDLVIPEQRYRLAESWQPGEPFDLVFMSGAHLYCGGIENPTAWEGPNVNFAHFDEARRSRTADPLKVLDGRIRIPGKDGTHPQMWLTSTPRKHWLFEYFGPEVADDPHGAFKHDCMVVTLRTEDNAPHLSEGYVQQRRQSLTEAEARVLLEAQWEDIDGEERFLPSMLMWDACREDLPALTRRDAMVLCADAGVSNDSFALVGVTRHPARHEDVAVRFAQEWKPPRGGQINFGEPEAQIRAMCKRDSGINVIQLAYDPYQLHDMATRLQRDGVVMTHEFPQAGPRLEADKQLLDLIMQRRIAHDGNPALKAHVDNADRKPDPETRKLRIVKREQSLKVDLCVALSMAAYRCLKLPL